MRPAKPIKDEWKSTDPKTLPDKQIAKHRARKNTKRWCKGKPGVEHNYVLSLKKMYYTEIKIYICAKCKKEDWSRSWIDNKKSSV